MEGVPEAARESSSNTTRARAGDPPLHRRRSPVRFRYHGYAASTMETIAADAGVARRDGRLHVPHEGGFAVGGSHVAGGEPDEPENPVDRTWFTSVMAVTSGARRLALVVELGNEIYRRVAPLMSAVYAAAAVDPAVDFALAGARGSPPRRDRRQAIDAFGRRDELRQGLDPGLALDLLFGVHRLETYLAFIDGCGWPMERYKAWQFATLSPQRYRPRSPRRPWWRVART